MMTDKQNTCILCKTSLQHLKFPTSSKTVSYTCYACKCHIECDLMGNILLIIKNMSNCKVAFHKSRDATFVFLDNKMLCEFSGLEIDLFIQGKSKLEEILILV